MKVCGATMDDASTTPPTSKAGILKMPQDSSPSKQETYMVSRTKTRKNQFRKPEQLTAKVEEGEEGGVGGWRGGTGISSIWSLERREERVWEGFNRTSKQSLLDPRAAGPGMGREGSL